MKTKIVPGADISAEKGLRAEDYINSVTDIPKSIWAGFSTIVKHCYDTSKAHGWWAKYDDLPEKFLPELIASKLMLIVSEAAEGLEEVRENDGGVYYTGPPNEHGHRRVVPESEWGEWKFGDLKPEGLISEIADVIIRCNDLAAWLNERFGAGDLAKVMVQKMAYNERRKHMHGGKSL